MRPPTNEPESVEPESTEPESTEPAATPDRPLLVVDAANVVGSVPDGWWQDRAAATVRLRDGLAPLAAAPPAWLGAAAEIVLVVEGAARDVGSVPGVEVVRAPGSGDDAIVELVRARTTPRGPRAGARGRRCVVVTADRGLRARVSAAGAEVTGPRSVWPAPARPVGG